MHGPIHRNGPRIAAALSTAAVLLTLASTAATSVDKPAGPNRLTPVSTSADRAPAGRNGEPLSPAKAQPTPAASASDSAGGTASALASASARASADAMASGTRAPAAPDVVTATVTATSTMNGVVATATATVTATATNGTGETGAGLPSAGTLQITPSGAARGGADHMNATDSSEPSGATELALVISVTASAAAGTILVVRRLQRRATGGRH
ncbi:hypothetical protein [Streptomyces sp. AK02-01A]|uniref:hypothetical protein n=1 Tax=Streptomyces sp. AK02-01A TaxID=3028648 RepID=UPI0029AD9627|nr:hypothetical protein [Streptomyces sp. AK02-01A]MDX3853220.1 hypothetical protein [Streptomyces sp. AK02-01A]